jgi:hypothetical protein
MAGWKQPTTSPSRTPICTAWRKTSVSRSSLNWRRRRLTGTINGNDGSGSNAVRTGSFRLQACERRLRSHLVYHCRRPSNTRLAGILRLTSPEVPSRLRQRCSHNTKPIGLVGSSPAHRAAARSHPGELAAGRKAGRWWAQAAERLTARMFLICWSLQRRSSFPERFSSGSVAQFLF